MINASSARAAVVTGAILAAAAPPAPAAIHLFEPVRISDTSPFEIDPRPDGAHCSLGSWRPQVRRHSEVEPAIAVDPRNENRLATAFLHDRLTTGGGLGIGVAYSADGGRHFTQTRPQNLSRCSRRDLPDDPADDAAAKEAEIRFRSHQNTLTFDRDGTLFLATRSFAGRETNGVYPGRIRITVSRSRDGGATWSEPVEVSRRQHDNRPLIVADRTRGGHLYMGWSQQRANYDTEPLTGSPLLCSADDYCFPEPGDEAIRFARSRDGGATWEDFQVLAGERLTTEGLTDGIVRDFEVKTVTGIVQLDEDSFVMTMSGMTLHSLSPISGTRGHSAHAFSRSDDGGETWSRPTLLGVSEARAVREVDHPPLPGGAPHPLEENDGRDVRSFALSAAARSRGGDVYVAWPEPVDSRRSRIVMRRLRAGATTWDPRLVVADLPAQSFLVQLAVQDDGTIGLSWYDLSDGDVPGDGEMTTRAWLAFSRDGGSTWARTAVSPRFDLGDAVYLPPADGGRTQIADPGLYVGDFSGLAPLRNGFALALPIPNPDGRDDSGAPVGNGESDIWFTRVLLPARG